MRLNSVGNFKGNQKDAQRAFNCFSNGRDIINSREFEQWFLKQKFTQIPEEFKGYSNTELYLTLSKPVEFIYQVIGRPWYKRWSSAIGYTIGNVITTYKNNFDSMSDAELSAHIIHELMHVYGHGQAFNYSTVRDDSIPYKVGNYIEKNLAK